MNNKKQKKILKAKIIDKIYLIITAVIVQGLLFAFIFLLMGVLRIPDKWLIFILLYLLYNGIIIGYAVRARFVRKYRPIWISMLILILMINIPWVSLLLLVLAARLPLPRYGWIYWTGMTILGTLTLFYYRLILQKLKNRQREAKEE